jgi:L,D-peptidoglycan transpeptidase YkuD (ErfK/YbiS/YcfS/YnhG family)
MTTLDGKTKFVMARTHFVDLITVRALSPAHSRGRLGYGGIEIACALGPGGIRRDKREGDGASPAGLYRLRCAYYRADRIVRPRTGLSLRPLRPDDGWCDDVGSARYNRAVRHPFAGSAEQLWRSDGLYDVLVVLGYNDGPIRRARGSAIFLHAAAAGYGPTAGCVAVARGDLVRLLAHAGPHTRILIV